MSLCNFTAFASDLEPTYTEVPISQTLQKDIQQNVKAQVVHQDGSETYLLEAKAKYKKDSISGYNEAKADAQVTSTMWFIDNKISGDQLTRARVEFSYASDVQIFNRVLEYGGKGTAGTNPRQKKIGMYFDDTFSGVHGGGASAVFTEVTADVESFGVTDTLQVYLKS